MIALNHYTIPHGDDWRILDDFFSTPLLSWILTAQAGHYVPITLSLTFLDYEYFGGGMHLLVAASLVCTWISAGALYVAFRSDEKTPSPASSAMLGFAIFLLFWAGGSWDFVWGMNQGTCMAVMFFMIALALLCTRQAKRRTDSTRTDLGRLLLASLLCFFATFSHGAGAASWAGIIGAAVIARFRPVWLVVFVAAALGSVALYSANLQHLPVTPSTYYLNTFRHRPVDLISFMAAFVGAPVGHTIGALSSRAAAHLQTISMTAGAIGLAGLAQYLLRSLIRPAGVTSRDVLSTGLMLLPTAAGLLVALNRLPWPETAVSIRFATWSTLFWIGAAAGISSFARERNLAATAALGAMVVSLAMLPALSNFRSHQERLGHRDRLSAAMHATGVQWDRLSQYGIVRQSDAVYRVVEHLRRDRRSFFSEPWAGLVGGNMAESFSMTPAARCRGAIRKVELIDARNGTAAQVHGVAWDTDSGAPPRYIALADSRGVARGLGVIGEHQSDSSGRVMAPWTGYIGDFDRGERYSAYGVFDETPAICLLGRWDAATGQLFKHPPSVEPPTR
jgi:hypothetical protein